MSIRTKKLQTVKKEVSSKKYTSASLPPDFIKLLYVAEENAGKTTLCGSLCLLDTERYKKNKDAKTYVVGTESLPQYTEMLRLFEDYNVELHLVDNLEGIESVIKMIEDSDPKDILGVAIDNITDVWDWHINKKAKQIGKKRLHFLDYTQPNVWHMEFVFRVLNIPTNVIITGGIKPVYETTEKDDGSEFLTGKQTGEMTYQINKKVWKKTPTRLELMYVKEENGKKVFEAILTKNKILRSEQPRLVNPLAPDIVKVLDNLSSKKKDVIMKK